MKIIIFVFLILICTKVWADEVLDLKAENSSAVLNEELRKINSNIDTLKTWINSEDAVTVYISGGIITASQNFLSVDTEAAGASDDLATINGGVEGNMLTLKANNSARTVVVKDATGNLQTVGDFSLTHVNDRIVLKKSGTNWIELSRSDNDA